MSGLAQARSNRTSSPLNQAAATAPQDMETDDFDEDDGTWQPVGLAPRSTEAATIVIRFGSAIHLEKIDAHDLGAALLGAARLTPKEIKDTYVKVRSLLPFLSAGCPY